MNDFLLGFICGVWMTGLIAILMHLATAKPRPGSEESGIVNGLGTNKVSSWEEFNRRITVAGIVDVQEESKGGVNRRPTSPRPPGPVPPLRPGYQPSGDGSKLSSPPSVRPEQIDKREAKA